MGGTPAEVPTGRTLALAVGSLVVVAVLDEVGPPPMSVVVGPAAATLLVGLARRAGLSWDQLGMGRGAQPRGGRYALAATLVVATAYTLAAASPRTRAALLDMRHRDDAGGALLIVLVAIPVGTVLFEEVAFRGVLWALLRRELGTGWATTGSSVLFGLWHARSSLRVAQTNRAVAETLGTGGRARRRAVAGVVCFTGMAGVVLCEFRRRSGSLLAPIGLHWATNGLGALASA